MDFQHYKNSVKLSLDFNYFVHFFNFRPPTPLPGPHPRNALQRIFHFIYIYMSPLPTISSYAPASRSVILACYFILVLI